MKIRMKVSMSGTWSGQPWPPRGGVIDVPAVLGQKLCAGALAEPVKEPETESATVSDDAETATVDTKPKRRGRPPKSGGLSTASMQGEDD